MNSPKEKGHGGEAAAVSLANSYSSDASNLRTGAQELWVTHFQDFLHSGARLREVQSRRSEKVIVREYWSDVCDEVVNDKEHQNQWIACVRDGIQNGAESDSVLSTRAKSSSLCQRDVERTRTPWRRLRWRRRRPQQTPQFPRTPRQSRPSMMPEPEPVMQPVQIVGRPLGPLKTIIDKELELSCFEKSERALQRGRYVSRLSSDWNACSRRCTTGGED